jgi:hypothetical protein
VSGAEITLTVGCMVEVPAISGVNRLETPATGRHSGLNFTLILPSQPLMTFPVPMHSNLGGNLARVQGSEAKNLPRVPPPFGMR